MTEARVYNFSPGPAMLPEEVLSQVRHELLDWRQTGMSVMELPHRGKAFQTLAVEAEQDLRDLLNIPANYSVLFLQGGAQAHFAFIPMNILGGFKNAAYVETGIWSRQSIAAAQNYCAVDIVTSSKASHYTTIADEKAWQIPKEAAYLYYVDNETVNGVEFPYVPNSGEVPLVCDMSSNILSRSIDVSRYGLIFACAQKNIAPAGLTIVIVRDDLLKRTPLKETPAPFRYDLQAEQKSVLNTPPTFIWYFAGLVFKWLKKQGGVAEMAKRSQQKSQKLYQFIDQSDFYHNPVEPRYRSRMNVIFTLADENLQQKFIAESTENGLTNLKGHRLVGGMRASIYNAMPEAGVDKLIAFLRDFEKNHR